MANEVTPRKGKRRPVGVYAPPHLREEQSENAESEKKVGLPVPECFSSDVQGISARQDDRRCQRSRMPSQPKQSLERDVFAADEQQCVKPGFKAGEYSSSKLSHSEKTDWLQGATDLSTNFWKDQVQNEEAKHEGTSVARFERTSLAEGWLHWLERLVRSTEVQMDAVVALYVDGLLRMETGEGPEEKREGLAEFLEAMLPATRPHADLSQQVAQLKLGNGGERREPKVVWLVENIWDAWTDWGQESSLGSGMEAVEEKEEEEEREEEFGTWLNAKMWGLGLDSDVCVPYVTRLLELEEGGTAIEEFLVDAALQTDSSTTLRFDPLSTTQEILARYRRQGTAGEAVSKAKDRVEAAPVPPRGSKKGKKKKKSESVLPADLFSHWWTSEDGADWGTAAAAFDDNDSYNEESWVRGSQWDDFEVGTRAESWGFDESAYRNGVGEDGSVSTKSSKASTRPLGRGIKKATGSESLSGSGSIRPAGKPPKSVVVARRMILHVLGLKDPNRRKR